MMGGGGGDSPVEIQQTPVTGARMIVWIKRENSFLRTRYSVVASRIIVYPVLINIMTTLFSMLLALEWGCHMY